MGRPLGAALAVTGAGQPLDFEVHQALGGKSDHRAQQFGVGTLLQQCLEVHHVHSHRRVIGSRGNLTTEPYRRHTMTTAVDKEPPAARLWAVAADGYLPTASTPLGRIRPQCDRWTAASPGAIAVRRARVEEVVRDIAALPLLDKRPMQETIDDIDALRSPTNGWSDRPYGGGLVKNSPRLARRSSTPRVVPK